MKERIEKEKVSEICNDYIIKGLAAYASGVFEEKALDALSFGELCMVYNNIGWFVEKMAVNLVVKSDATKYKKYIRSYIFRRLSAMNTYVIYADVTNLPYVSNDGGLRLYTEKEAAEEVIANTFVMDLPADNNQPTDGESVVGVASEGDILDV